MHAATVLGLIAPPHGPSTFPVAWKGLDTSQGLHDGTHTVSVMEHTHSLDFCLASRLQMNHTPPLLQPVSEMSSPETLNMLDYIPKEPCRCD